MDLLDIFQQYKIRRIERDTQTKIYDARTRISDTKSDIKVLEDKIEHLSLVTLAMAELMADLGISKSMLLDKIEQIDLRDGKRDGRFVESISCEDCSRLISKRHRTCLYCGGNAVANVGL